MSSATAFRQIGAVVSHETKILLQDPTPIITLIFMPLVLTTFMQSAFGSVLVQEGFSGATGAEQAVPGMSVMFAYFFVANIGFAFFREHGWNTWERLRATTVSPTAVVLGKIGIPFVICVAQLLVLFLLGTVLFDLNIAGSYAGLVLIAVAFAANVVAFGVLLVGLCRTVVQLNAFANLLTVVLAGVGGALVPLSVLPGWAQAISPGLPSYWAMNGFREAILSDSSIGDALLPAGVLFGFTAVFAGLSALFFRFDATKTDWS